MPTNAVAPQKLIALKLYSLGWLDRRWMLGKLEQGLRLKVIDELAQLKKMKVQNPEALLQQLSQNESSSTEQTEQGLMEQMGLSEGLKAQIVSLTTDGGHCAPKLRKVLSDYLVAKGAQK